MVLEKIDGIPCTDIAEIDKYGINKKELAENGVMIWLNQVLEIIFFMPICIQEIFLYQKKILIIQAI